MRFDLAVVGAPFLDVTFAGIPHLPAPGEEVFGADLHVGPGGAGMQAIAAARLGLRTALVSPVGEDPLGRILADVFEREGVAWIGPPAERTAVTAILPTDAAAAMATFQPREEVVADDVRSADASAVLLSLGRLGLAPPGAAAYVVTGPGEIDRYGPDDVASLRASRAVILNEREASSLTEAADAASAARALSEHAATAVVTLGAEGAIAAERDAFFEIPAPDVRAVDATGAGDVLAAAYVWADRAGVDLEARVRWATLYASLSTTAPTAYGGVLPLERLLEEGERRGLTPP